MLRTLGAVRAAEKSAASKFTPTFAAAFFEQAVYNTVNQVVFDGKVSTPISKYRGEFVADMIMGVVEAHDRATKPKPFTFGEMIDAGRAAGFTPEMTCGTDDSEAALNRALQRVMARKKISTREAGEAQRERARVKFISADDFGGRQKQRADADRAAGITRTSPGATARVAALSSYHGHRSAGQAASMAARAATGS